MGKKVRSARGEMVDFDLIKIREQMSTAPVPVDVKQRRDFVESRLRRRLKKADTALPEIMVEPIMPSVEEPVVESAINQKEEPKIETEKQPKTKQRARRTKSGS